MGWFWSDAPKPDLGAGQKPLSKQPPPECPMHNKANPVATVVPAQCPRSDKASAAVLPPVTPSATNTCSSGTSGSADQSLQSRTAAEQGSVLSKLNPLNYMPFFLSQEKAAGQTIDLPINRERSTIPRADGTGSFWEYPSPQQMYNAMVRKGYTDTPADAVESMVAVHNFLNEGAWAEILEWERRFAHGLSTGARLSFKGEQNARLTNGAIDPDCTPDKPDLTTDWDEARHGPTPLLSRFMGRPHELTPKARILHLLGYVWPSRFGNPLPFDRHDWYVVRKPEDQSTAVRYVIDYYDAPDQQEPDGTPVFYLDVRPAIDSPDAAARRLIRWSGDVWWQAMGGQATQTSQESSPSSTSS